MRRFLRKFHSQISTKKTRLDLSQFKSPIDPLSKIDPQTLKKPKEIKETKNFEESLEFRQDLELATRTSKQDSAEKIYNLLETKNITSGLVLTASLCRIVDLEKNKKKMKDLLSTGKQTFESYKPIPDNILNYYKDPRFLLLIEKLTNSTSNLTIPSFIKILRCVAQIETRSSPNIQNMVLSLISEVIFYRKY